MGTLRIAYRTFLKQVSDQNTSKTFNHIEVNFLNGKFIFLYADKSSTSRTEVKVAEVAKINMPEC